VYVYTGAPINPSPAGPLVTTDTAIQRVFDWFNAAGGPNLPPVTSLMPGLSVRIPNSLRSPYAFEWDGGVSHQTSRTTLRADVVYRDYRDFYSGRIDQSTGSVVDQYGTRSDLAIVENTDLLTRRYAALTASASYRFGAGAHAGGNYTLSRLWGNFDGESANSGPLFADVSQYPEYRRASWYLPEGDLAADQRHRANLWFYYSVPKVTGLTLSVLEQLASGLPYGALGQVDARPFVSGTTYVTPQGGPTQNYYYTARDAFRTAASYRTDFALNYAYGISASDRRINLFGQLQVLNVFNNFQLCGCGADVFSNGGAVVLSRIGSSVLNPTNTPSLRPFNPFTTAPIEGINWNYGSNFGTALNRFAYTSPRTLRLSLGIRF